MTTRTTLMGLINANLPDNLNGDITAAKLREVIRSFLDETFFYQGDYVADVTYFRNDFVRYNSTLWVALRPVQGATPAEGADWTLFLQALAVANQAESEAGVEPGKALSPLGGRQLIDTIRAFAEQADAEELTSTDLVMNPFVTKFAIAKFLTTLPTALPAEANVLWNNGGVISVS